MAKRAVNITEETIPAPKDPVTLSGGYCAGRMVEGAGWKQGTEREFQCDSGKMWLYRRLVDDGEHLTPDNAVFVGKGK